MAPPARPETGWTFYSELGQLLEERCRIAADSRPQEERGCAERLRRLLLRLYSTRKYSTLIGAHWGPFRSSVESFVVEAAERSVRGPERVAALRARKTDFHVAYSFFFSRGNIPMAGGAMARLATLCEEAAESLARQGTYDQEDALLSLLLSARSAWALAATVSDIAPPQARAGQGELHCPELRWGYPDKGGQFEEIRKLQKDCSAARARGDLGETQRLEARLSTLYEAEGLPTPPPPASLVDWAWTRAQVLQRYSVSRARVLLATAQPSGYALPGTLSASAVSNPDGFSVRPSTLLRFTEPQLLDCLARRGDVDEALAFAGRSRLSILPIVQALCNRIILCLDLLISDAMSPGKAPRGSPRSYLEGLLSRTSIRLSSLKPFNRKVSEPMRSVLRRYLDKELSEPAQKTPGDLGGGQYAAEIDYCAMVLFAVLESDHGSSWGHQYYTGHASGDVVCALMHATVRRGRDNRALPLDTAQELAGGDDKFFFPQTSSFRLLDILRYYLPDVFSEASPTCSEQVFGMAFRLGLSKQLRSVLTLPDRLPGGMPNDLFRRGAAAGGVPVVPASSRGVTAPRASSVNPRPSSTAEGRAPALLAPRRNSSSPAAQGRTFRADDRRQLSGPHGDPAVARKPTIRFAEG